MHPDEDVKTYSLLQTMALIISSCAHCTQSQHGGRGGGRRREGRRHGEKEGGGGRVEGMERKREEEGRAVKEVMSASCYLNSAVTCS